MKSLLLLLSLLVVALASVSVYADDAQSACSVSSIVSSADGFSNVVTTPVLSDADRKASRTISLYEPAGATDQLMYSALIDHKNQQAWVYQYGGFAGVSNWYGPFKIDSAATENCSPAKGFIPVAVVSQQQRDVQPVIPSDLSRQAAPVR